MKLRIRTCFTLLMLVAAPLLSARTTPLKGTAPERLLSQVRAEKQITVIVGVADPVWKPEGYLAADAVRAQRARGRALKARVLGRSAEVVPVRDRDLDTIPFFVATVTERGLRALLNDESVSSIEADLEAKPALLQSTVKIGAVAAHSRAASGYKGEDQYIVVIDQGVDRTHPFLNTRIESAAAACFSGTSTHPFGSGIPNNAPTFEHSTCPNGQTTQIGDYAAPPCSAGVMSDPLNTCHHGTRVAGVAAGTRQLGQNENPNAPDDPLTGVAPGAKIIPIQVASYQCDPASVNCPTTTQDVTIKGYNVLYALQYVHNTLRVNPLYENKLVVNISLAFDSLNLYYTGACDSEHPAFASMINNLHSARVPVVVATGNKGEALPGTIGLPACIGNAIAVSATTDDDAVAPYANTSATVDLFAPGGEFQSPDHGIETSTNTACGCGLYTETVEDAGTSMAAPHVAGALAILRKLHPTASVDRLVAALHGSGAPVTGAAFSKRRIDVNAAIDALPGVKGDFSSDGKTDLVLQDSSTGEAVLWRLNGTTFVASEAVLPAVTDPAWAIAAAADFNDDGRTDLVWRNASTSQTKVWLMDGATRISEATLPTATGAQWRIAGSGDFDANGSADLVWQNSSTFQTVVWLLNGTAYLGEVTLPSVSSPDWSIRGVGDFNADGKPDLVWRHATTFQSVVWLMNGTVYSGEAALPGVSSADWNIEAVGDYNGDAKTDLVWRNAATRQVLVWLMNGTTWAADANVGDTPGSNWRVAAPR